MAQIACIVGIDVSKGRLDCYRTGDGRRLQIAYQSRHFDQLGAWLGEASVVCIALEASGGYERAIAEDLLARGYDVQIVDPARVRYFRWATGRRAKNDTIDAQAIAEFVSVSSRPTKTPRRECDQLAELLTLRDAFLEHRTRMINYLEHLRDRKLRVQAESELRRAEARIAVLDQRLAKMIAAQPRFAHLAALLDTVKGVGPVLIATLLARLPELGSLSRRTIAALVGLAPFDDDSGKRQGKRTIKGGRHAVRRVLYMATMGAATRHNPQLKAFYQRLIERGKPAKVALTACARKLLTILNAMVAHGTAWRTASQ